MDYTPLITTEGVAPSSSLYRAIILLYYIVLLYAFGFYDVLTYSRIIKGEIRYNGLEPFEATKAINIEAYILNCERLLVSLLLTHSTYNTTFFIFYVMHPITRLLTL